MWDSNLRSREYLARWIMNNDWHCLSFREYGWWTVYISCIRLVALLPFFLTFLSCKHLYSIGDCLSIPFIILAHSFIQSIDVVLSNKASWCTCDSIMMLCYSEMILKFSLSFEQVFDRGIICALVKHLLRVKKIGCVEVGWGSSDVALEVWSRRIVACPVSTRTVHIREQIVIFCHEF